MKISLPVNTQVFLTEEKKKFLENKLIKLHREIPFLPKAATVWFAWQGLFNNLWIVLGLGFREWNGGDKYFKIDKVIVSEVFEWVKPVGSGALY